MGKHKIIVGFILFSKPQKWGKLKVPDLWKNKILKIPEKSYITIFCITTQCVRGEAIIKVLTNRFGVLYFDVRVPYPAYDPALALKSSHPICTQMPMWVEIFAHYW